VGQLGCCSSTGNRCRRHGWCVGRLYCRTLRCTRRRSPAGRCAPCTHRRFLCRGTGVSTGHSLGRFFGRTRPLGVHDTTRTRTRTRGPSGCEHHAPITNTSARGKQPHGLAPRRLPIASMTIGAATTPLRSGAPIRSAHGRRALGSSFSGFRRSLGARLRVQQPVCCGPLGFFCLRKRARLEATVRADVWWSRLIEGLIDGRDCECDGGQSTGPITEEVGRR